MAAGSGGQIGLTRIGSLYRDINSVNLWSNFTSETLEHKLEELSEGSVTGNYDSPPSFKGIDHGVGDISGQSLHQYVARSDHGGDYEHDRDRRLYSRADSH